MTLPLYQVKAGMISGLNDSESDIFNKLLVVWQRKLPRNQVRERYYNARNGLRDLGISIPPQLKHVDSVVGWPAKAVDDLAARSVLRGFTFDGVESEELSAVVDDCGFLLTYEQAVKSELADSCAFLTVSKGRAGEPGVIVSAYSALNSSALWDWRRKRILAGLAVIDVAEDRNGITKPTWVNLYTDTCTASCRRLGNGRWEVERLNNPLGRPLMEPLAYMPSLDRPFGKSRISRPVMAIADSALRCALRTEVAAEFFTQPQRYAIGIDKDTFGKDESERNAAKLKAYIGGILALTPNKNGDLPQYGQLPQMSMQPHSDYLMTLAKRFAGETSIPVQSLGIIQDNPSSAEAIYASTGDLIVKAESLNRHNARALRNVARMVMCCVGKVDIDGLSDEKRGVTPRFENPMRPSIASRADFAVKVASMVPAYAQTSMCWRDLGYDEEDVRQMMREINRASAQMIIASQVSMSGKEAANVQAQAHYDASANGGIPQPD